MNQKRIFYLLSLIVIFFIGHYYSQFNNLPVKPKIVTINNTIEIEEYKAKILNLQFQLDELDTQLINMREEFMKTYVKLSLSQSTVATMKKVNAQQDHENAAVHTDLLSAVSSQEKEINSLREQLASTLIELELSQFEIELLEEQLSIFLQE